MDRREFLKAGGVLLVGSSTTYGLRLLFAPESRASEALGTRKWGMVVDLDRCMEDCTVCLEACREENNVAYHDDERWDIHWIRKVTIRAEDSPKRDDGIVVIDHHRCIGCRYCVVACPYNARFFNFKHNHEWPNKEYPKRSHGVAESCNFCAHLLDEGEPPACVDACPNGALIIGDLNDPDSEVSRLIASLPVKRLRDDLGTKPKVYYIGLATG
jgi:molybdopterin-containing oxidoreductase family iron-sulfur binding subunit